MKTAEPTRSKNGWPLGIARHPLGWTYSAYATVLATKLKAKYCVDLECEPMPTEPRMQQCWTTCRMSMQRFGELRAYIDGFNANS